jgi:hypothetical protein
MSPCDLPLAQDGCFVGFCGNHRCAAGGEATFLMPTMTIPSHGQSWSTRFTSFALFCTVKGFEDGFSDVDKCSRGSSDLSFTRGVTTLQLVRFVQGGFAPCSLPGSCMPSFRRVF